MAAMIVPEMKGSFEDAVLRSSGRELVDVFSLAYSRAVSFNRLHRIRLDNSTGRYVVERQGEDPQGPEFELATDISGFQGQIDPRIAVEIRVAQEDSGEEFEETAGDQPKRRSLSEGINFYADGTADGCEILLRDRLGFQLVLQVDPITAGVHLLDREEH